MLNQCIIIAVLMHRELGDYQAYCADVPTGGRASLQCLQTHLNELSPPCANAVGAATGGVQSHPPSTSTQAAPPAAPPASMSPREKIALMRRACGPDFRTYCRGVPLGGGQALACLSQNESHLSTHCRDALAEAQASR